MNLLEFTEILFLFEKFSRFFSTWCVIMQLVRNFGVMKSARLFLRYRVQLKEVMWEVIFVENDLVMGSDSSPFLRNFYYCNFYKKSGFLSKKIL